MKVRDVPKATGDLEVGDVVGAAVIFVIALGLTWATYYRGVETPSWVHVLVLISWLAFFNALRGGIWKPRS